MLSWNSAEFPIVFTGGCGTAHHYLLTNIIAEHGQRLLLSKSRNEHRDISRSCPKEDIIQLSGKSAFVSDPKVVPKPGGRSRLVIDYSRGFIAYLWPLLDNNWISMRALYRQQQTPEEMQNVRDIIQHSPGTMSLTISNNWTSTR